MSHDPDSLLQHQIHYQVVNTLLALLPPPLEPTADSLEARNAAAIARVSDLRPVNADEIDIALHCVLSRAQAADVMRSLRDSAGDLVRSGQLSRQYALMERTAQADRRLLLQVQAARRKREAEAGTADQDAWSAYITRRGLERAVAAGPALPVPALPAAAAEAAEPPAGPPPADPPCEMLPPDQAAAAPPPEPATPVLPTATATAAAVTRAAIAAAATAAPPASAPSSSAPSSDPSSDLSSPAGALPCQDDGAARDLIAEAERYVREFPRRARIIRLLGRVTPACDFAAPDDALREAIFTGDTPFLRALDSVDAQAA